jgi:hypothetical protein
VHALALEHDISRPAVVARIQATGTRGHHPIATEDDNELTFKSYQSMGAGHLGASPARH